MGCFGEYSPEHRYRHIVEPPISTSTIWPCDLHPEYCTPSHRLQKRGQALRKYSLFLLIEQVEEEVCNDEAYRAEQWGETAQIRYVRTGCKLGSGGVKQIAFPTRLPGYLACDFEYGKCTPGDSKSPKVGGD